VSNPDSNAKNIGQAASEVQFTLGEHGIRFNIPDGGCFAFRPDFGHFTSYRRPSQHHAYVACVTVNTGLRQLMQRRQLSERGR